MGIKISALTPVGTPALSDVFPIVQSGVTYKESFTQLTSLFATSGANSNITSLTGLTGYLQAPLGIKDANGNPVLTFLSAGSAVNWLLLANSATGGGPQFFAEGADSNVSIYNIAKGTGQFIIDSANTALGPLQINSGTGLQHTTNINFADTANTRQITFPDFNGTVVMTSKANGTEAANAVTASGTTGVITTSSLTTAGGANYAITWTNTFITTSSTVLLSIMGGTNTTNAVLLKATAGAGTSTLTIYNLTAATALNGTILIGYMVIP
jgi:hypothetical protein